MSEVNAPIIESAKKHFGESAKCKFSSARLRISIAKPHVAIDADSLYAFCEKNSLLFKLYYSDREVGTTELEFEI